MTGPARPAILARLRPGGGASVVPVVRLAGPIGMGSQLSSDLNLARLAPTLYRAFRLKRAPAVALAINSPGGAPAQAALIAQRIRDLAGEHDKPVYAFCEDVAASGGYWLACGADEIYASSASLLGAIGVVSSGFGFHRLIDRLDIERRVYTAGESKAQFDPFQAEDPDAVTRLRAIQDRLHGDFKAYVRQRRGSRLAEAADEAELFDGRIFDGRRAWELGLIDGLGEIRGTLQAKLGGRVRLRVVNPEGRGLRRFLPGQRSTADGAAEALDSLAAGLEARALWARYGL